MNSAALLKSSSALRHRKRPAPRRFEFVHNSNLRPVLEQAYSDSRRALEQNDYDLALRTSCGILEAIVTDALEHKGSDALAAAGAPAGKIAIGRSKLGLPSQKKLDSFAAGAHVYRQLHERTEITKTATARIARRMFPSATLDRAGQVLTCHYARSGSQPVVRSSHKLSFANLNVAHRAGPRERQRLDLIFQVLAETPVAKD